LGLIYGNKLDVLERPRIMDVDMNGEIITTEYPEQIAGRIIVFPLCSMKLITELSEEEKSKLLDLRKSVYKLPPERWKGMIGTDST
jgi:hypothetical protein